MGSEKKERVVRAGVHAHLAADALLGVHAHHAHLVEVGVEFVDHAHAVAQLDDDVLRLARVVDRRQRIAVHHEALIVGLDRGDVEGAFKAVHRLALEHRVRGKEDVRELRHFVVVVGDVDGKRNVEDALHNLIGFGRGGGRVRVHRERGFD